MSLKKVANLRELPITERFPETIGEENGGPEARKFSVYTLKGKSRGSQQLTDLGYVVLPMPKINDAVNVSYSDAEFGAAGAVSVGSMGGNISGDFEKLSNIMKTGLSSFNQTTVGRVGADLATKAFPGLRASLVNGLRTIANPYLTNVFKSTGFRQFSFSYSLRAKSSTESETITRIIKIFKKAMMPEDILVSKNNASFQKGHTQVTGIQKLPDIFDIKFFPTTGNYQNGDAGNDLVQIKNAVLTDMKTDYSSDTQVPTFFKNTNAPMGVNLTLTFKETTIYTRERCNDDYSRLIFGVNEEADTVMGDEE
tara:strand:+ start:270 stop:1199 length:930 start_codon:yes stop_codon:yes gene_type:complete